MKTKWTLAVARRPRSALRSYARNVWRPRVGIHGGAAVEGRLRRDRPARRQQGAEEPGHRVKLKTQGVSDVYVTGNTIAPGGQSGWHTHPGPSLIIVTVGEVTAYAGDDPTCTPTRYRAGEGFVDPGGGHVHLLRNETGAPAETVAVQFLPKDATRRIDTPAPGNCASSGLLPISPPRGG